MFHPVFAFIGLRYAKASPGNHFIAFINLFSVVGIALGVMSLITVLSVMNGFEGQLKNRILGIMPHIVVDTRTAAQQDIDNLSSIPGVTHVTPLIESEGVIQSLKGIQGTMIQGIEPSDMQEFSVFRDRMLVGKLEHLIAGEYGVVIGRALAAKLNIRYGDDVRILAAGASTYTPFGRLPSQRIFRVVGIYDVGSELDDKVVLLNVKDNARLLRKKPQQLIQSRLVLEDAFQYLSVENTIDLPSDNWRRRQGPLFDAVKMEKNMMGLMLVLIIAVAAFNIISALVMVVTEKQGDIAILKTQGMASGDVMKVFMMNGLYNGIKGTGAGLILGMLLVSQMNNLLSLTGAPINLGDNGQGLPVDLQWQQITVIVGLSLALSFIATLYPAYRAVKVEPAKALKYE